MSDEKKYSAEYAAKVVLNKVYELTKSKQDSLQKSEIGGEEGFESLKKALYAKVKSSKTPMASEDSCHQSKESILNDLKWKLRDMKELRELAWMVEDELPELKDDLEAMYTTLKRKAKEDAKRANSVKKSEETEQQSLDKGNVEEGNEIQTVNKSEKLQLFVQKVAEKRSKKEDTNG